MAEEIAGKGDPLKTLQLLWGRVGEKRRGPKPRASLEELVAAAIGIADREGLDAVTTRRVAEVLNISPMSFYTYVPGKDELLDLMLDAVAGEGQSTGRPVDWGSMPWRERLTLIATELWDFFLKHPWVMHASTHRPVLGPRTMAAYEAALSAVDGIGLDELEMDRTISAVWSFVLGAVRDAARVQTVKLVTGMSDDEWWARIAPFLETIDYSPYPVASRVGPVTGAAYGAYDAEGSFAFGLARLLDGLELYLDGKRRRAGDIDLGAPNA